MKKKSGAFKKKKVYFSQVSNVALRDNSLSLKAKGLYALIQSYITIENFTLYKTTLLKQCKESDHAFESAWKELKDHGYLIQTKYGDPETHCFCYEYELLDVPSQGVVFQGVDNPPCGKVGVYNKTDLNNTDLNNKYKTLTSNVPFDDRVVWFNEEYEARYGKPARAVCGFIEWNPTLEYSDEEEYKEILQDFFDEQEHHPDTLTVEYFNTVADRYR